jgi:hypothetical protein
MFLSHCLPRFHSRFKFILPVSHGLISLVYSCLDPTYFPTDKYLTDLQDADAIDASP